MLLFKKEGTGIISQPDIGSGKNSRVHHQRFNSRALGKQWQNLTESAWIYKREIMLDKSTGIFQECN